jgi:hypothetical protein
MAMGRPTDPRPEEAEERQGTLAELEEWRYQSMQQRVMT